MGKSKHPFTNARKHGFRCLSLDRLMTSQRGLAEHDAPECLSYDWGSVFDVDGLFNLFP